MPDDFDMEYAEQIMFDGQVAVDCTYCDYSATVEPDCDCPCPGCGEGRLISPLREWGLI